jgi:hypothetical protein
MTMDLLAHILLSMFSLSTHVAQTPTADNQPAVRLAPITAMLRLLVAELAPADATHRFEQAALAHAGTLDLAAVSALVAQAEQTIRASPLDQAKLQQIARSLDQVGALAAALRPSVITAVEIVVKDHYFFDFVTELSLPSIAGHTILIGRIPPGQERVEVRRFAKPTTLRQIAMAYVGTSGVPLLTLQNLRRRIPPASAEFVRGDWPLPIDSEVLVYTWNNTLVLKMYATHGSGDGAAFGEHVQIRLPKEETFLTTYIVDTERKPLLTCIKVI